MQICSIRNAFYIKTVQTYDHIVLKIHYYFYMHDKTMKPKLTNS